MGSKPTIVMGARAGTPAEKQMEHISAFVGRELSYYATSVQSGCFPVGTLSLRDGYWFEVQRNKKSGFYPKLIDPPAKHEIITRPIYVQH